MGAKHLCLDPIGIITGGLGDRIQFDGEVLHEMQALFDPEPSDFLDVHLPTALMAWKVTFVDDLIATRDDLVQLHFEVIHVFHGYAMRVSKALAKIFDSDQREPVFDLSPALKWSFMQRLLHNLTDFVCGPDVPRGASSTMHLVDDLNGERGWYLELALMLGKRRGSERGDECFNDSLVNVSIDCAHAKGYC